MEDKKIRIVLADDHSILREGTKMMLSDYEDVEVVGQASNALEMLKIVQLKRPDVLITDLTMPGASVFEVLLQLQSEYPRTRILVLTMHESADYIFKALDCGVAGYLTKNSVREELIRAIRQVYEGEEYYGQNIARLMAKGYKTRLEEQTNNFLTQLTRREKEIMELIAQGFSSKEIAARLFLSERTVSNHRASILQKAQVNNTVELVRKYLKSL